MSQIALEPSIETRDTIRVVGMEMEFVPDGSQSPKIGEHWARFAPVMHSVPNRTGNATYGVIQAADQGLNYLAGVAVTNFDSVPEGMVHAELPPRTYAIFTYDGGIGPQLGPAMDYVFEQWLPNSGYTKLGADFEYYDDAFDPATGTGRFYIYVPVISR